MRHSIHSDVKPIGAVIQAVLQHVEQRHTELAQIQRTWTRLVGPALAQHTKPVSFRKGRLTVLADQPGDNFLLNYERPRLLKRLQETTQARIAELVIRPGKPEQKVTGAAKPPKHNALSHRPPARAAQR